jgi:cytidyltransferase-like protein
MKKHLNVYADMVCDLFHSSHVSFMKKAIEAGKEEHLKSAVNWSHINLIVGIHDDETIKEYKEIPAMTLKERVTVVEACRYVDKVIPAAPTIITEEFIREHDIDLVVHAHSAEDDDKYNYQHAVPRRLGIFKRLDRCEGVSSTEIKDRIINTITQHYVDNQIAERASMGM